MNSVLHFQLLDNLDIKYVTKAPPARDCMSQVDTSRPPS